MTIKGVGSLSITEIATEFGGAKPFKMSQFYRNGGRVPDTSSNSKISTAGQIKHSMFYGAMKAFNFNISVSANTADFNLRNAAIAAGWTQVEPLVATITINGGVYVYASSTGTYAFDTSSGFPAGSSLTVINYGAIVGHGGNGGRSNSNLWPSDPCNGGNGGPALIARIPVTVYNYGTIGGGGGGGGGGAGDTNSSLFGGAGGGGAGLGAGGQGAGGFGNQWAGSGTLTGPGSGIAGGNGGGGNVGGNGGAYGQPGAHGGGSVYWDPESGGTPNAWQGNGGQPGAAVVGNGNIAWGATGSLLGAIT